MMERGSEMEPTASGADLRSDEGRAPAVPARVTSAASGRWNRLPPIARIGLVLAFLVAIGVFLWTMQGAGMPANAGLGVGSPAPDFSAQNLPGQTVDLHAYRGKTVILNFWATWCEPCRAEMPALDRVSQDNPGRVAVVAVDVLEGPVLVKSYVDELHLRFVPLLDPSGNVTKEYHVDSLPTSFFISSDGTIKVINVGPMDQPTMERNLRRAGAEGG